MVLYGDLRGSDLNLYRWMHVDLRKWNETVHFCTLSETECLVKMCY